ncbi:MAG: ATP-dependent DNA helicase RecG [Proteobacteria bacterium]|nr:ATP-dependent DNA helicase RecG [Pseudomonadota bacterium]
MVDRLKGLSAPIQYVKGVGPRMAALLQRKGIETVEDALYFIPRDYEDRRKIKPISKAEVGKRETLLGEILGLSLVLYTRRKVFKMVVGDKSGSIIVKWFNFKQAYLMHLKKRFKKGQHVIISGKIEAFRYQKEISHPDIEIIDQEQDEYLHFKRIVPRYSETEGLHQKNLRRIMKNVVDASLQIVPDGIPRDICRKRNLVDISSALQKVHFPENEDDIDLLVSGKSPYHRRIIFDEFFFLELGLALRKRGVVFEKGISFKTNNGFYEKFDNLIPFSLTSAQKRVIDEIKDDMAKPHPMHRLIQGDVGSGKTIVAFAATLIAVENNYQAAIMAPTELLAEQHYLTLHQLAKQVGLRTTLLVSGIKSSLRKDIYKNIKDGNVDLIIGTHAIIQEAVKFSNLGLGIIDEQHRFGVVQRASLRKMGPNPDILVMTATPIPRTLAMTVYGDLDISVVDEMPPGRLPVKTRVFHEKDRLKVYEIIAEELKNGFQTYIVYPLVEESDKMDLMDATQMYEQLQKEIFPHHRLALLHGRMKSEEKEKVMQKFKDGEIEILIATTVIEVGIDIPRATLMVIEHAERFGLSQLHQLRGRVGRGEAQSRCILLAQYRKSDEARRRLSIMEQTNDGFKIAEEDLNIRGPGEFFGVRQSGLPDFRVANIIKDARILYEAREEAFELVRSDPLLENPEHFFLKEILKQRWKGRLELAGVG